MFGRHRDRDSKSTSASTLPERSLLGWHSIDQRMVRVETYTAELTITQPREIALYEKAFDGLARSALYGQAARGLITDALNDLSVSEVSNAEDDATLHLDKE